MSAFLVPPTTRPMVTASRCKHDSTDMHMHMHAHAGMGDRRAAHHPIVLPQSLSLSVLRFSLRSGRWRSR